MGGVSEACRFHVIPCTRIRHSAFNLSADRFRRRLEDFLCSSLPTSLSTSINTIGIIATNANPIESSPFVPEAHICDFTCIESCWIRERESAQHEREEETESALLCWFGLICWEEDSTISTHTSRPSCNLVHHFFF
jgi:hypothetical protein